MLDTRAGEVAKHTGATQTTDAGRVGTVAAYSSGDSLSSRLIASRTSAPPSVAFAPCGKVGKNGRPYNINSSRVPARRILEDQNGPIPDPNDVVRVTRGLRHEERLRHEQPLLIRHYSTLVL